MEIINKILNLLFIWSNNKENNTKYKTIQEFNYYIEQLIKYMNSHKDYDFFSNLTNEDRILIKNIIFKYNYPRILKPYAKKLYEYTDIENLLFCAINLCSIKIEKSFNYREINGQYIVSDGSYYSEINRIRYYNKSAIPHEFMHMCSRSIIADNENYNNGFEFRKNKQTYSIGINEGYTELLSRKIYYDGDYNSDAYTTRVFAMRLLELLYDNQKDMERDYLRANHKNLKKQFLYFGSEEEYLYLASMLNIPEWDTSKEEKIIVLNFIKEIVKRTQDSKKTDSAEAITENFQKIIRKKH